MPRGTVTELLIAKCRLCFEDLVGNALDFGAIPIGNRFSVHADGANRVDLAMTGCPHCGLVQLLKSPDPQHLVPKVDWIRYREPEGHLDDLAEKLTPIPGDAPLSAIGIGPFEEPLLKRLQDRGWTTKSMQLVNEADRSDGYFPYLETWQARMTTGMWADAAVKSAQYDLVSCRYLLEHSSDPLVALSNLGSLLAPGGRLLVEVPDSAKFLTSHDYCFPWEEHICYFVEASLVALCRKAGFTISAFLRYPGALEDALVAVLEKGMPVEPPHQPSELFESYRSDFVRQRTRIGARLAELADGQKGRVALFGMGHQAIMFANVFGLKDFIGVAVDDEPGKLGLYPPGLAVPITSSETLLANDSVTVCMLAVSPSSEAKVRQRLAPLARRGVKFFSIFSGLPGSISAES